VGVFEARFSMDEQNRIDTILLVGDFIANSAAVEKLEERLRACPLQVEAIDRIVHDVFDGRQNFLLGIGKLDLVARLLVQGAP
jgi:hypothetical protein